MKVRYSKLAVALMTGATLSTGVVSLAPSAAADTPGCVTRAEFQRIDFFDSNRHVRAVFDTAGRRVDLRTRQYRTCRGTSRSYATVYREFQGQGVDFKWLYIETPRYLSSNKCVTRREFRRVHKDMRKTRVRAIFDTVGQHNTGGSGGYQQYYQSCDRPHRLVLIGYEVPPTGPDNVYGKWYVQYP